MSKEWIFLYDKKPIREGWQRVFLLSEEVGGWLHSQFIMNEQWGVECMDVVTNAIAWMSHSLQLTSEWVWLDLLSACQKYVHIDWLPCNNVTNMVMFCHHDKVDQGIWLNDHCWKGNKVAWTLGPCFPVLVLVVKHKWHSVSCWRALCHIESDVSVVVEFESTLCVIMNVVVQWVQHSLLLASELGLPNCSKSWQKERNCLAVAITIHQAHVCSTHCTMTGYRSNWYTIYFALAWPQQLYSRALSSWWTLRWG